MPSYFDDNHIRNILQSVDLVEIVSSYVALKSRGREMIGLCPFHDDSRPSMNVSPAKQIFKCFACGAGGNVITFIMLRERMTFPEAVRMLADRAGITLPQRSGPETSGGADRNDLEKINRWAARHFRNQYEDEIIGKQARDYVVQRRIDDDTAKVFGLGWAPESWDNLLKAAGAQGISPAELARLGLLVEKEQGGYYDRFRQRLIFPVIDGMGRITGFGGRTLGGDPAKYLNSPESVLFDKSRSLYGLNRAKDNIVKEGMVVVVEGYTDCLMAHQKGICNVVATLGTALTSEHARMLSRYTDKIVLVFDGDEAGQKAADRAVELFFSQQVQIKVVTLPEGTDPCDFLMEQGGEAFMELVLGATEALEYKWQEMGAKVEGADAVGGRKRAVEEFLTMIARMSLGGGMDKISEGFVLNRVAKLVEQPVQMVHETVSKLQRQLRGRTRSGTNKPSETNIRTESKYRSHEQILEVLLNRPDMFEAVKKVIEDVSAFEDPELRQVAQRIWSYCQSGGEGPLGQIVAGCESTGLCQKMTDMAERGSERGNFQETLEGALVNLEQIKEIQERAELRAMVPRASEAYGPDAETAMLLDLQSRVKPDMRRAGAR